MLPRSCGTRIPRGKDSGRTYEIQRLIDSVVRLLPGALGDEDSCKDESFSGDALEYPHYTRPADYKGMKVPDVLLSGNHEKIKEWRRKESIKVTKKKRPDLLKN